MAEALEIHTIVSMPFAENTFDLVTAYFFTRPMVVILGRNLVFTEARWFGVARGLAVTGEAPA